jgi:hypothetical protein
VADPPPITLTVKPIKASVNSLGPGAVQDEVNKNPMPDALSTVLTVTSAAGVGTGGALAELLYVKFEKSKLPIKQEKPPVPKYVPPLSLPAYVEHALSAAAGRAERPNALTAKIKVVNL